jgi:hypothetical protein
MSAWAYGASKNNAAKVTAPIAMMRHALVIGFLRVGFPKRYKSPPKIGTRRAKTVPISNHCKINNLEIGSLNLEGKSLRDFGSERPNSNNSEDRA